MEKWKLKSFKVLTVAVIISVISAAPHKSSSPFNESYRLPKSVIPESYELLIETSVHDNGITNFGGTVKIKFEVVEDTNEIKLHSRNLTVVTIKLTDQDGTDLEHMNSFDLERDFLILTSFNTLTKGHYNLELSYVGRLKTSGTSGFYRSEYQVAGEDQPRYLAATQFEPTRAREAFPCFDEPEYKATFKLTITHGSIYHALSNTEGETEDIGNGLSTTTFKETPKMPTYLLAFVVSDLISSPIFPGVYARPEHVAKMYTAIGSIFSTQFLQAMEQKFDFKFDETIGKLDSVAVPDHGSAMENWGLILYKEQYLILEELAHPYEMYDVIGTIAHEIAHQFFGNAVTCKWWDQIWLNEGFATWLEFKLPNLYADTQNLRFPELFNIKKTQVAFKSDSLESTRPMTYDANTPSEISALFDDIAYDKAGAVLRMFEYAIGSDIFTSAMTKYLTDNQHKSVTSDNLLSAIEDVLPVPFDFNITRAFRTWELNKGYPLVSVTYNSVAQQFSVTQKRYLSVTEELPQNDITSWYIPLSYTTGVNPNFENTKFTDYFVDGDAQKIISTENIPQFDGSQWFIFNLQQLGYYRVNYDESNWKKIIEVLHSENYQQIHVLNRAQLVDDALTFAFDGLISYDIAFDLVSYLRRETDYIPWYAAMTHFDKLDYILKRTDFYGDFQRFVRILVRQLYSRFDFSGVNSLQNSDQLAVELAVDWLCRTGDRRCLQNAYNQMKSRTMLKPLEITYICNGMKGADRMEEYTYLFDRMNSSVLQSERLRILNGLICSTDRDIANKFIHTAVVGNTFYRNHETRKILSGLPQKSPVGLELLAGLIDEHYDDIISSTNEGYVDTLLADISKRISTDEDEHIITDILSELEIVGKAVKPSVKEEILKNIAFNKKWAESSMSNSASVYIHNVMRDFNDFENALRLPQDAIPEHYEVKLDVKNIDTGALPYTGEVKIDVRFVASTDRILLHSKDHEIIELKVYDKNTMEEIDYLDYHQNDDVDTLAIYFTDTVLADTIIHVHIEYSAKLLTEIDGFYRDSYVEFDEFNSPVTKYLATTQFQAVEARRAFPCFDEPEFRTEFDIIIRHPSTYNAVSNMPANRTLDLGDGTSETYFDRSHRMSTYLLAFLVSDFKYLSNEASLQQGETPQRIYTRPGKEQKAKYGLDNSVKLLNELEKFAGVEFNLPKLDSGAIPGKGGGMENWGLILYREEALVYEDDIEDIAHDANQRGVRLIAHEIAHMFFGNLVTAKWWNYLWLNEGFATYVMYYLSDKLYPEWHMNEFYNRNIMLSYAFLTDASEDTRSMSSELITVDDINNSFDDIAYDKASCVLRMFHHAIGDEIFREALTLYLNENKYQPVTSQNLIDAVTATLSNHSIPINFEHAFRTWENQEGFPVLNVRYDQASSSFRLTQERFFDNKSRNVNDPSSWYIPINYATASNNDFGDSTITHYFPDASSEFVISDNSYNGNDWYVFNKQQIGYYRVNYDEKNWKALTEALHSEDFEEIHITNRVQLIDDAFRLANAGYIDIEIAYEIMVYLKNDTNFFAWDIAMDNIYSLFAVHGPRHEILNRLMFHLSKNFYNHYDLSNKDTIPREEMPERYGRNLAISIACKAGNEQCLEDAIKFGAMDVKNEQRIPPGLEEEILCNYFRQTEVGDEFINVFNRMNALYQPSQSRYKSRLINALGCTKNADFLYELLETSIGMHTNNVNHTQSEKRAIFNAVLANENGIPTVFKLINNYPGNEMPQSYGWSWRRILTNIADYVYTDSEQYLFLEYIDFIENSGLIREGLEEARDAASHNLDEQKKPLKLKQLEIIVDILGRVFDETTIAPPTTVTEETTQEETTTSGEISTPEQTTSSGEISTPEQTTSSGETSTPEQTTSSGETSTSEQTTTSGQTSTQEVSTTPVPQLTTPDNASSSIKVSVLVLLLAITIGLFINV